MTRTPKFTTEMDISGLDHLAAMQGLSRAEWVGGELETDKSLRARIHATVAKELGFDGAGKLLLGR